MELLEAKVNAAVQYSRRNCLRIAGVPGHTSENTDKLDEGHRCEVSMDNIEQSHRVGKRRESVRPRQVLFISRA